SAELSHHFAVTGYALAVECGLGKLALSPMKFAFACEQAFPEKALGDFKPPAFHKVPAVSDQNVLYVIGVVEKKNVLGAELEVGNIPVVLGDIHQETERVAAK